MAPAGSAANKNLALLLRRQPAGLRRRSEFEELASLLAGSPALQRVRLGRRAWRLLDEARIAPENLSNFFRTYRVPRSEFFRRFVILKRGYLDHLADLKRARREYIRRRVATLPPPVFAVLRELGRYERGLNRAGRTPVWDALLFPRSKKEADACHRYGATEWRDKIADFGKALSRRYPGLKRNDWECAWASLILECGLETPPAPETVRRNYRRLSKRYHPDAGGDPLLFRQLKEARDRLLDADG